MKTSLDGINFIKRHEGYSAVPYKDSGGKLTIGYGHLIKPGEVFGAVSNGQATQLLINDVALAEAAVNEIKADLTQAQFDALVDFAFNLGGKALIGSTLKVLVESKGSNEDITTQFSRWCHDEGKIVAGLVKRRMDEARLFATGNYDDKN